MSVAEIDGPEPSGDGSPDLLREVVRILATRDLDRRPEALGPLTENDLRRLRRNLRTLATATLTLRTISTQPRDAPSHPPLTAREREILVELQWHQSVHTIARSQHVSDNTIKTHLLAIYRKLDAHERAEAVRKARLLGLL